MLVDAALTGFPDAAAEAARLEALGYDGAFSFEGPHDPFFPLVQAAAATERITLYPAVAIAFARNPMLLAQIAQDLQTITGGRFLLGLGTQIREGTVNTLVPPPPIGDRAQARRLVHHQDIFVLEQDPDPLLGGGGSPLRQTVHLRRQLQLHQVTGP